MPGFFWYMTALSSLANLFLASGIVCLLVRKRVAAIVLGLVGTLLTTAAPLTFGPEMIMAPCFLAWQASMLTLVTVAAFAVLFPGAQERQLEDPPREIVSLPRRIRFGGRRGCSRLHSNKHTVLAGHRSSLPFAIRKRIVQQLFCLDHPPCGSDPDDRPRRLHSRASDRSRRPCRPRGLARFDATP